MLNKRIIPCLDVRNGRLTKGIQFQNNADIGDPVEAARRYSQEGADEIIFFDITASLESRSVFLEVVKRIAREISVPFCVGGGLSSIVAIQETLEAGAKKIAINSAAVKNPQLIKDAADTFGSQTVTVGLDVKKTKPGPTLPSGYEIVIQGGRIHTGLDALQWAARCEALGAGEICLNSIDADGTRAGYDLELTAAVSRSLKIPVIASGGAGSLNHIYQALTIGQADAALLASVVHYGELSIPQIKTYLLECGLSCKAGA